MAKPNQLSTTIRLSALAWSLLGVVDGQGVVFAQTDDASAQPGAVAATSETSAQASATSDAGVFGDATPPLPHRQRRYCLQLNHP